MPSATSSSTSSWRASAPPGSHGSHDAGRAEDRGPHVRAVDPRRSRPRAWLRASAARRARGGAAPRRRSRPGRAPPRTDSRPRPRRPRRAPSRRPAETAYGSAASSGMSSSIPARRRHTASSPSALASLRSTASRNGVLRRGERRPRGRPSARRPRPAHTRAGPCAHSSPVGSPSAHASSRSSRGRDRRAAPGRARGRRARRCAAGSKLGGFGGPPQPPRPPRPSGPGRARRARGTRARRSGRAPGPARCSTSTRPVDVLAPRTRTASQPIAAPMAWEKIQPASSTKPSSCASSMHCSIVSRPPCREPPVPRGSTARGCATSVSPSSMARSRARRGLRHRPRVRPGLRELTTRRQRLEERNRLVLGLLRLRRAAGTPEDLPSQLSASPSFCRWPSARRSSSSSCPASIASSMSSVT